MDNNYKQKTVPAGTVHHKFLSAKSWNLQVNDW